MSHVGRPQHLVAPLTTGTELVWGLSRVTGWVATEQGHSFSVIGLYPTQGAAIDATLDAMKELFRPGGDLEGAEDEVRSHLRTEGWYRDGIIVNRVFEVAGEVAVQ